MAVLDWCFYVALVCWTLLQLKLGLGWTFDIRLGGLGYTPSVYGPLGVPGDGSSDAENLHRLATGFIYLSAIVGVYYALFGTRSATAIKAAILSSAVYHGASAVFVGWAHFHDPFATGFHGVQALLCMALFFGARHAVSSSSRPPEFSAWKMLSAQSPLINMALCGVAVFHGCVGLGHMFKIYPLYDPSRYMMQGVPGVGSTEFEYLVRVIIALWYFGVATGVFYGRVMARSADALKSALIVCIIHGNLMAFAGLTRFSHYKCIHPASLPLIVALHLGSAVLSAVVFCNAEDAGDSKAMDASTSIASQAPRSQSYV